MDEEVARAENTQRIRNVTIPFGYEVWNDGVFLVEDGDPSDVAPDLATDLPHRLRSGRKRVTQRPLWISAVGVAVDTKEPLVKLSFCVPDGRFEELWVERADITDYKRLVTLGGRGLPIDSLNCRDVLLYLRLAETANAHGGSMMVGHRSAPYMIPGSGYGWLVGGQWIGPGHLEADPRGNLRHIRAYRSGGDWETWKAKWLELYEQSWVTRWLIAATFTAPLLRLTKTRSFIVHHWGDSSSGKTSVARFAMSAWGDPDLLFSSLNRTAVSLTEVFRHVTDLPVLFDEKQVSTVSSEEIIYSICLPSGRERGARDGGLRNDRQEWLTVARTTGEEPLIKSRDLGGQINRVLQIHSQAFATSREAEALYPLTAEHFGHAGPRFLAHLADVLNTNGGLPRIVEVYRALRQEIADRVKSDGNHTTFAANISLGSLLPAVWLLGKDADAARATALADAEEALSETAPLQIKSYAERALNLLRDHWMAFPYMYVDDFTPAGKDRAEKFGIGRNPIVGAERADGMGYIPAQADKILTDAGFHPERVWRDFATRGWLMFGHDGGLQAVMTLRPDTPPHPVFFVRQEVWRRGERASFIAVEGGRNGSDSSGGGVVLSFSDAVANALSQRR